MSLVNEVGVVVVDDEAPARRKILRLLRHESQVRVLAEADSGEEAVIAIEEHRPDLVFLDVQMPGMDGFAVIERIGVKKIPPVVFVTAHDEYALRAFEVHAFDYLLKPFSEERFHDTLQRVRRQRSTTNEDFAARLQGLLDLARRERNYADRLLVPQDARSIFVPTSDILWIEADRNYVNVHCAAKGVSPRTYTIRGTLEVLQSTLDPKKFVRVHRSAIVRIDAIRELQPWFHGEYKIVLTNGDELRWSRRFVAERPDLLRSK